MDNRLLAALQASLYLFLSVFFLSPGQAAAEDTYTLAVVPQFEQRKLFATWTPIVAELERRTGQKIRLVATLTVPEFEHQVANGNFDFVYANPYLILREESRQGYIPLVRDNIPLRGILVVRKDSPYQSPEQLSGRRLAVPSFNALGASLLIRADLKQIHDTEMQLVNAKTHSSVYLHVVNKLADAGGGIEKTLQEQPRSIREQLRVLYTTRSMPSHPIAAHPRVPQAVRESMRKALLEMAETEEGHAWLAEIPMSHTVRASIRDYEAITNLNLERYWIE